MLTTSCDQKEPLTLAGKMNQEISFLHDSRSDLYFAYYWGGMANGGPALALVNYTEIEHSCPLSELKGTLTYFQHQETGICFAYYWGGMANGGPALTEVPYGKVKHLLEE